MAAGSPTESRMMRRVARGLVGGLLLALAGSAAAGEPLERIAFGSCARQDRPQPVWDAVRAYDPDLFVLMGDNVYADTADEAAMRAAYARLAAHDGFARLRAETPLLATWDDHDYGVNDGGADFSGKRMAERVFLDFFDVPADDPRRQRDGVYTARTFGPAGRRVQVIVLDERFFRSSVPVEGGRYVPRDDTAATMLGAAQWTWLEDAVQEPAQLRLLVSGTQVLPRPRDSESWSTMPHERARLLELLRGAGPTILLSGDRHFGEILRLPADAREGVGYPLYEVTASGLNSAGRNWESGNPYRFGDGPFPGDHFGAIDIDWDGGAVVLKIVDVDGDVVRRKRVEMPHLAFEG